jgi:peptide/nickel transport system substrate-binding protein
MDEHFNIQPQMAQQWTVRDDGLIYTITLREGLAWHDGWPVRAEDCIASLKRWSARDAVGQKVAQIIEEYKALGGNTLQIVLNERFGQLIEGAARLAVLPRNGAVARDRFALETDPMRKRAIAEEMQILN